MNINFGQLDMLFGASCSFFPLLSVLLGYLDFSGTGGDEC